MIHSLNELIEYLVRANLETQETASLEVIRANGTISIETDQAFTHINLSDGNYLHASAGVHD